MAKTIGVSMDLPKAFLSRMRLQLGDEFSAYLAAMESAPRRALRINPLKTDEETFLSLADFPLERIAPTENGYFFSNDVPIGKHPLHVAGLCYAQEPAAQMPASLLSGRVPAEPAAQMPASLLHGGLSRGMAALDLCAAPGGKSGQLAAYLENTGILVANEPVRARADALIGNFERLGVRNALVTCMRPDALCEQLYEAFDAVLVDAPCSGEGMFRMSEQARAAWSARQVCACAERQGQILRSAALSVKRGGVLIYSTCTFSPEENEQTVAAFLGEHADFSLVFERRLYPHTFPGEGQYMAKLAREGSAGSAFEAPRTEKRIPAWEAFCRETFAAPPSASARLLSDHRVMLLPERALDGAEKLRVLRAGVLAGEVVNQRFEPAHALIMAYPASAFLRTVPLVGDALSRFLAGEVVPCDPALSGWCAATAYGFPIGWGKAVNGVLKNHIPKGLRVR